MLSSVSPRYRTYLESTAAGQEILARLQTVNSLRRGINHLRARRGTLSPNLILDAGTGRASKRQMRRDERFYTQIAEDIERWAQRAIANTSSQPDADHLQRIIEWRFDADQNVLQRVILTLQSRISLLGLRSTSEAQSLRQENVSRPIREGIYGLQAMAARGPGMKGILRQGNSPGENSIELQKHLVVAQEARLGDHPGPGVDDALAAPNRPSPFSTVDFPLFNGDDAQGWPFRSAPDGPNPVGQLTPPPELRSQVAVLQRRLATIAAENPPITTGPRGPPTLRRARRNRISLQLNFIGRSPPPEGEFDPADISSSSDQEGPSLDDISTGRPTSPARTDIMTEILKCSVCFEQKATISLVPCGHLCLCEWCANATIPGKVGNPEVPRGRPKNVCPLCRGVVRLKLRVHFP